MNRSAWRRGLPGTSYSDSIRDNGRRHEAGFTLVETIIAISILMAVLIPAILFLGKAVMRQTASDAITAVNLAQEEMERTIALRTFRNRESSVLSGRKQWRVVRTADAAGGLVEIRVAVYRPNRPDPIVELKTLRTAGD
jgi:Tfp pilus assembly protein PilV